MTDLLMHTCLNCGGRATRNEFNKELFMEQEYLKLLHTLRGQGAQKGDRTGTGTLSIFGHQMRCDLAKGFPLLTTKKVNWKAVVYELLWFIRGDTNIKYLQDNGVKIWDEWANENGDLGPVYGEQWRNFGGVDQLLNVIQRIKEKPNDRRLIVSSWNPVQIDEMALPPCHCLFQFYVVNGKLSCQLYQRSADVFLGVPFNIASYALLTHLVAQVCDLEVGDFIHTFGDVHIYNNHLEQVNTQLCRVPRALPTLNLSGDITNILDFGFGDIKLSNYNPHPFIKAKVAI